MHLHQSLHQRPWMAGYLRKVFPDIALRITKDGFGKADLVYKIPREMSRLRGRDDTSKTGFRRVTPRRMALTRPEARPCPNCLANSTVVSTIA